MYARKKVQFVRGEEEVQIRNALAKWVDKDARRQPLAKDVPLIVAAIASDRTVISLDEEARSIAGAAAIDIKALTRIVWVNPAVASEGALKWLIEGARDESRRLLGGRST